MGIDVSVAESAGIWWGEGERSYAAHKGAGVLDADRLGKTPEGANFVKEQLRAKVYASLQKVLPRVFAGSRPVKVRLVVKRVQVSAPLQRMFVGGEHIMIADVEIVDARTGKLLSVYPEFQVWAKAGQGLVGATMETIFAASPVDRVIDNLASKYANWLLNG